MKKLLFLIIVVSIGATILFLSVFLKSGVSILDVSISKDGATITDQELKKEIGQMITIGFRGTEVLEGSNMYKIIKDVKIGGVVFADYDVPSSNFPRNIVNPEQTKKLISDLQKYSATPLFVAVDAEGGNINRLKQQYGFFPVLSPEEMGKDKTLITTRKESIKLAKELKGLGFNMNLAPVVDVNINPKNPIIGALGRSFSSDSEEVYNQAKVFIESHLGNNIITVGKHFPGQGSAKKDSHIGMTDVTDTYSKEELYPYQKLNEDGLLYAVMTAHIIDKKIDSDYPATLSAPFLQGILRNQIGFKGVIISDDIQMGAIDSNYKFDEAVIKAINAGCDLVSIFNNSPIGYDGKIAYKVRDIIFNAVKSGKIKQQRITESYNRIFSLKKQFRIIQPSPDEVRAQKFELIGMSGAFNFGEALDLAKYVGGITGVRPAFLLAISQEELTLEKLDLCYLTNFDTGEGVGAVDGKVRLKTMKPERDITDFLKIAKELGKDPSKTLVTCPMSFGWGGAMGPADFIPSTWMRYKDKIEKITGKLADPWDIRDAFLAMGLYLSDSGAALKNSGGERNAAIIYFSGSTNSAFSWYADGAFAIADKIEKDILLVEESY